MTPENVKNYGTGWAEFTQLLEAHYMVVLPWAVKTQDRLRAGYRILLVPTGTRP